MKAREKAEEKAARASINDILMNELLADGGDDEGDMVLQGGSFGAPVPRVAWAGVRATESLDHGAAASVRVASAGDRVYSLRALPSAARMHWEREMAEVAALNGCATPTSFATLGSSLRRRTESVATPPSSPSSPKRPSPFSSRTRGCGT